MTFPSTPTGRITKSEPAFQRLPLPLTQAQREDVERIRRAVANRVNPLTAWYERRAEMAQDIESTTRKFDDFSHLETRMVLYDSWLNRQVTELYAHGMPAGMQAYMRLCTADLDAHLRMYGADLDDIQRKTVLVAALQELYGSSDELQKPIVLN